MELRGGKNAISRFERSADQHKKVNLGNDRYLKVE